MDKDRENGNILIGKFNKTSASKPEDNNFAPKNQTNPIYKQLFKLVHQKIDDKHNYKSFSDFKPKDLR